MLASGRVEYHDGRSFRSLHGCEQLPVVNLVAHLEREQDGGVYVFGEFEHERRIAQADVALRASLGDDRYQEYICKLEELTANATVEREAAIKNWDVEHLRTEIARGYRCKCAEWGMPCNCAHKQKIGRQCGSVAALEIAASLQAQGREAESALEAAALRVARAEVESDRLMHQRVDRVRAFPSRREGRLVRKAFSYFDPDSERSLHEKQLHLADRLLRAYPSILVNDSARAMAVYRHVSACGLIAAYSDRNSDRMLQ